MDCRRSGGSGSLSDGRSALTLPAGTFQAVNGPNGTLTALRLLGANRCVLRLERYTFPSGVLVAVDFDGKPVNDLETVYLTADPSGRYVVLNEARSTVFGWLRDGQIKELGRRGPFGWDEMLATAW